MSRATIVEAIHDEVGSEIQYASFGGCVTIDVITGVSGTTFPIGTIETPVNNVTDAILIDNERGFKELCVIGNIVFEAGNNIDNFVIKGESPTKTLITIEDAASVTGTEFLDAEISGVLDGNNTIKNCKVGTLQYVEGYIQECLLEDGTITLGGSTRCDFLNCWSGVSGTQAVIDMGGSGRALGIRAYSGSIKIINKTGSDKAVIDLISGRVIIDSTVINGEITVRGVGTLEDNSTGSAVIIDSLLSQECIAGSVWKEPYTEHTTVSGSTAELISQIKRLVNLIPAGL